MDWKFDEFAEPAEPAEASAVEREDVPEGEHRLEIVRASESGAVLQVVLAHQDKRYRWVWAKLRRDNKYGLALASGLARALGMSLAEWNDISPADLVGREVVADLYHKAADNGRVFVNVRKFSAVPQPEPEARQPAKRSRSAQPAAANDDIPF
jgi:hypothetical protein